MLYTVCNNRVAEIIIHGPMIQYVMSILNVVKEQDMSNVNFSRIWCAQKQLNGWMNEGIWIALTKRADTCNKLQGWRNFGLEINWCWYR